MGAVPTVRFSVSIRPTQAARLGRISESLNGSYSAFADLSISAAVWQVSFVRRERPTQRESERDRGYLGAPACALRGQRRRRSVRTAGQGRACVQSRVWTVEQRVRALVPSDVRFPLTEGHTLQVMAPSAAVTARLRGFVAARRAGVRALAHTPGRPEQGRGELSVCGPSVGYPSLLVPEFLYGPKSS